MSDDIATDDETGPVATSGAAPFSPREPKYDWGIRVTASVNLMNDGSHPQSEAGTILVPTGTPGEIVRIGHIPEANVPVYLVEFPAGLLVGCFEEEIVPTLGERAAAIPGRM
ncbi:MAG TPA: nitrogen fixation protein NifZ [Azospirillaceae bacterium]|nr:nitrogen fixation protein NifZ [Azospirillaceae bacterium]